MSQLIAIAPDVAARFPDVLVFGRLIQFAPPAGHVSGVSGPIPRPVDWEPEWRRLHAEWTGKTKADVAAHPTLAAFIDLTRRIGLNPKNAPPSVVNLIQRFLLGPNLDRSPRINPIVDAVNVAAVETLIPLGAFDSAAVQGPLQLARTAGGEPFRPLGTEDASPLPAGVLVLRDDEKVLSQFGSRDGEAQKVTPQTRRVWLLGCRAAGVDPEAVEDALDRAVDHLRRPFDVEILA